jgi:SWIM/SEC-C metal-binding protein
MPQLGSKARPAVVRVQTMERAEEILVVFEEHGWQCIVGIEENRPEDISDLNTLLSQQEAAPAKPKPDRNAPCPCGSGLKYKKCCLPKERR